MTKPTLLVNKVGAFRTFEHATALGEHGNAECVLRRLCEREDVRVVYFGTFHGDRPCPVVEPTIVPGDQRAGWEADVANLRRYEPFCGVVQVCGYAGGRCFETPGYKVQVQAVRYMAPLLNILLSYKLRRICVNNDMRTYPKNAELVQHPELMPAAILDCCDRDETFTIQGMAVHRRTVYSRSESWQHSTPTVTNADALDTVVVSHAHIGDGYRDKSRAAAFEEMLHGGVPVYGVGWEHFEGRCSWEGELSSTEVKQILSTATTHPMVSYKREWYTNKLFITHEHDSIPLFYGRGGPATWDPRGIYLPLDSPWRVTDDLRRVVGEAVANRAELRAYWRETLRPDWSLLDEAVDRLVAGDELPTDRFGGYEPCWL